MVHAYVLCPVTVRGFCSELEAHELSNVGDQLPPPPLLSGTYPRQPLKHLHTAMLKALMLHYLDVHFDIAHEQQCTIVNLESDRT